MCTQPACHSALVSRKRLPDRFPTPRVSLFIAKRTNVCILVLIVVIIMYIFFCCLPRAGNHAHHQATQRVIIVIAMWWKHAVVSEVVRCDGGY